MIVNINSVQTLKLLLLGFWKQIQIRYKFTNLEKGEILCVFD